VHEEEIRSRVKEVMSIPPETLERLERDQVTQALTLWRGFEAFCGESRGVEAIAVLKVVLEPGVERIEELEDLAGRLELTPLRW
jgi:hypothetical protein